MGRREIFAGNWKMYTLHDEAVGLVKDILKGLTDIGKREVIVFPPSPHVRSVSEICRGSRIDVGMQNMYFEKEGAFTGEVSPLMARDAGCRYVLIGHSERRHVFGETDGEVNKKVTAALAHDLDPVICVGELLEERESGRTEDVIRRQVEEALKGIHQAQMERIIVAYEPVWAIGTGKVATPETADEAHEFIRQVIQKIYGEDVSASLPILYGGSVKPDNISGLFAKKNIDGVLVGGASLKAESFLQIVNVE